MFQNLGEPPATNAHTQPEDVAIVFGDQRITFAAHFQRAQKVAGALSVAGLVRQDRIAVLARNCPAYLEIYSAAQRAGFIVATVNFRLAPPEIAAVLADAAPSVLFFEAEYAGCVEALRAAMPEIHLYICIDGAFDWAVGYEDFLSAGPAVGAPFNARSDDVMHLIYTSGTTGKPKGVMRTHAAEAEVANLMTTEIGILREDVVQIMMPLFHVGARWVHLGAQARGARIVLHRDVDAVELLTAIQQERVTVTHMAPTIVQQVLDYPRINAFDVSSLKTIYYAAAPMPLELLRRAMARLGPVFVQAYGMTEGFGTTLHKGQHQPDGSAEQVHRLRSVGQASSGVRLRIVDDDDTDLPAGSPGEILTSTTTRMAGYWNNSIATSQALRDGWYRTGDVGYLDAKGFLYLVDRKKDMIISGGENIYCREVEQAIALHESVADVAVFGLPDAKWGESVVAVVVCKTGLALTEVQIIDHCRTVLASYKKPKVVHFAAELPRLNTGKVDKVWLRAAYRKPADRI
jgi:acyl-CoA synthetase (AMP-forming)/AMP-acid ligase II